MRSWQAAALFQIGGGLYMGVEYLWRGWSHPSMLLVGGLCFLLIAALRPMAFTQRMLLGAAVITAVELGSGLILNDLLHLAVWDYSGLPLNLLGQICLPYALLWVPLAGFAAVTADWLRHWLFHGPRPAYRWI